MGFSKFLHPVEGDTDFYLSRPGHNFSLTASSKTGMPNGGITRKFQRASSEPQRWRGMDPRSEDYGARGKQGQSRWRLTPLAAGALGTGTKG